MIDGYVDTMTTTTKVTEKVITPLTLLNLNEFAAVNHTHIQHNRRQYTKPRSFPTNEQQEASYIQEEKQSDKGNMGYRNSHNGVLCVN